jgi:hypothetical protein
MTHSYPQGYISIADAWQEACSKLAPPESKPLDNATFDDDVAYDAKVRIVERLMRSALADGLLPVFVQTKNGETERLTDRELWRAAALVPDTANIPAPVTNPAPETDGRPALLKVSDLQEWIWRLRVQDEVLTNEQPNTPKAAPIDAASATSLVAEEVEKHAIAVQQWWREFVERAFNKPDWSKWEVFSWIAWRDPTLICAIEDDSTLRAYRRHGLDRESSDEPVDDDSDFTLVDALKKGRLPAIREGAELPREYWFGKAPRDLGPNVYFRREDVLAVRPAAKDLCSALEAAHEASTGRRPDSRVEANTIAEASYHGRIEGSKTDAAAAPAGCDALLQAMRSLRTHPRQRGGRHRMPTKPAASDGWSRRCRLHQTAQKRKSSFGLRRRSTFAGLASVALIEFGSLLPRKVAPQNGASRGSIQAKIASGFWACEITAPS